METVILDNEYEQQHRASRYMVGTYTWTVHVRLFPKQFSPAVHCAVSCRCIDTLFLHLFPVRTVAIFFCILLVLLSVAYSIMAKKGKSEAC